MPPSLGRIQLVNYDNFKGGLNLADDQFQLAPNESPALMNMDIATDGGVKQRDGLSPWGGESGAGYVTTTSQVYVNFFQADGLSATRTPSGTKYLFGFHVDGATRTIVYATSASSGWTSLSTYPTVATYISAVEGTVPSVAGVFVYMANFTDATRRWDGTTLTTLTDVAAGPTYNEVVGTPDRGDFPKCKYITIFQGKMVAAAINENGTFHLNRVRFSHGAEYEDWRASDYIDISAGEEGDTITGVAATTDKLFIFKEHSIWAVTGTTAETIQVFQVSKSIGAVHQRAIVVTDLGIFFYDARGGVYLLESKGNSIRYMFDKLKELIDNETLSVANAANTCLSWNGRRLYLGAVVAGGTYPSRTFVLDMYANGGKECWMEWNLRTWQAITTWRVSAVQPTTIIATTAPADSKLKVCRVADPARTNTDRFTGTTDVAITSYYTTAWFDLGQPAQQKRWRRPTIVVLDSVNSTLRCEVYHDWDAIGPAKTFSILTTADAGALSWYAGGSGVFGTATWAGGGTIRYAAKRGGSLGNANSVQLKINGPLASELVRWGFTDISLRFIPKRIR